MKGTIRATLNPDVTPTLALWSGVENRYLDAWGRFGNSVQQNGGVGNLSSIRFRNPSGSKIVAVLELVEIVNTTGDTVTISFGTAAADLGTVVAANVSRLDARAQPSPTLVASTANQVAQQNLSAKILGPFVQPNVTFDLVKTVNQEITILPGDGIGFDGNTTNNLLRVAILWRERSLEDSELT